MSARSLLQGLVASTLLAASGSMSFAQNASDIMRLFGGLMQGAIAEGAKAEWRKVRPPELACIQDQLQTQGTSTAALAQQGIFPTDGRVAGIRTGCARATIPGVPPAVATLAQPAAPGLVQANNALQSFVKDNSLSGAYQGFFNGQAEAKAAAEERARQEAAAKAAAEAERQRQEAAAKAAAEAERQRLEQEATAKREADEQARQEAAAKSAAEEQARLLKNDRIFLDDAQAFLKAQTKTSIRGQLRISHRRQHGSKKRSANSMKRVRSSSRTQLHDLLSPIKGFGELLKDREAERQRVLVQEFMLAEAKAKKGVYFVSEYLRGHLGDPKTGTLLTLQGRLEGSLRPNSIDDASIEVVDQANQGLDRFISDNSLSGEYKHIVEFEKRFRWSFDNSSG